MKVIKVKGRAKVSKVKSLMKSIGNHIGVVHFIKRSDGRKRKMSYRLRVFNPQYAKAPTGKNSKKQKKINSDKNLMTVFDTNCFRYNNKGKLCGRGSYKSVPLDSVTRLAVGGEIYKFVSA